MARIYKYKVASPTTYAEPVILSLPKKAKILSLSTQVSAEEEIFLWAEVDPDAAVDTVRLMVLPTGVAVVPTNVTHLGTVHFTTCRLVFHVYRLNSGATAPTY